MMESPSLIRALLPVFIPYLSATVAAANVLDRGVGPLLVGLATTAIVLTLVRAYGERERRQFLDTD